MGAYLLSLIFDFQVNLLSEVVNSNLNFSFKFEPRKQGVRCCDVDMRADTFLYRCIISKVLLFRECKTKIA